jgi:hypothetical protein
MTKYKTNDDISPNDCAQSTNCDISLYPEIERNCRSHILILGWSKHMYHRFIYYLLSCVMHIPLNLKIYVITAPYAYIPTTIICISSPTCGILQSSQLFDYDSIISCLRLLRRILLFSSHDVCLCVLCDISPCLFVNTYRALGAIIRVFAHVTHATRLSLSHCTPHLQVS